MSGTRMSGASGCVLRLFLNGEDSSLENEGKEYKHLMPQTWPGSPRHSQPNGPAEVQCEFLARLFC